MLTDLPLIVKILYAILAGVYGYCLIVASDQDFKHRALTVKMAWAFIIITTISYVLRGYWFALAAYWVFFLWSYFLYEVRPVQIAGGLVFVSVAIASLAMGWFPMEQTVQIAIMGFLWSLAFSMPRRGESDFNILYTNMAFFGVEGYMVFIIVLTVLYFLMLGAKIISRFQNKTKNFLYLVYAFYFELTDPTAKNTPMAMRIQELYPDAPLDAQGETPIPLIPLMMVATMLTSIIYGAIANAWMLWIPGVLSLVGLVVAVLVLRNKNINRRKEAEVNVS